MDIVPLGFCLNTQSRHVEPVPFDKRGLTEREAGFQQNRDVGLGLLGQAFLRFGAREADQVLQRGGQAVFIPNVFHGQIEVEAGNVIGEELAVPIENQSTGRLQLHRSDPVLLREGAVVCASDDLQVPQTCREQEQPDQQAHAQVQQPALEVFEVLVLSGEFTHR